MLLCCTLKPVFPVVNQKSMKKNSTAPSAFLTVDNIAGIYLHTIISGIVLCHAQNQVSDGKLHH